MSTRTFETRGPVDPIRNYVVPRSEEIADLAQRIKDGRYIVIFAPRQTGKTTFFRWALDALEASDKTYFPIQLDFEAYKNLSPAAFYNYLHLDLCQEILTHFQERQSLPSEALRQFFPRSHRSSVGMYTTTLQRRMGNNVLALSTISFIRCDAGASRDAFPTKTLGTRKTRIN
jgi:hypothetical protein